MNEVSGRWRGRRAGAWLCLAMASAISGGAIAQTASAAQQTVLFSTPSDNIRCVWLPPTAKAPGAVYCEGHSGTVVAIASTGRAFVFHTAKALPHGNPLQAGRIWRSADRGIACISQKGGTRILCANSSKHGFVFDGAHYRTA